MVVDGDGVVMVKLARHIENNLSNRTILQKWQGMAEASLEENRGMWQRLSADAGLAQCNLLDMVSADGTGFFRRFFAEGLFHGIGARNLRSDYQGVESAILLPATLRSELQDKRAKIRLVSEYPFPWRKGGGPKDSFERGVVELLSGDSTDSYKGVETLDGHEVLRRAVAYRMSASCVDCHNNHPDTPRTGWKVGDVAGVWSIIVYPTDEAFLMAREPTEPEVLAATHHRRVLVRGYRDPKSAASEFFEVENCYQRELEKNSDLAGKVLMKVVISADGSILKASTKSSTLHSAAVESCLLTQMKNRHLPKPKGAGISVINYQFVFEPPPSRK